MSQIVFLTGANRGIGLAVAKILLANGDTVIGAVRNPSKSGPLDALKAQYPKTLQVVPLDQNDDASTEACGRAVAALTDHVDAVLNIAGVQIPPHDQTLEDLEIQKVRDTYETDVIGPLRVTRALMPLLKKGHNPRLVNVSSGVGSIAMTDNPWFYSYGPAKAALNKVSRTLSFAYKADGVCVVALDPGWVRTDLGGPNAPLAPEESAGAIVKTLSKLDMTYTGKFIYNDGKELPW